MQDFPRADRVVRPYGGKWEINTGSPENRHKTAVSCGSMWASTPTAWNINFTNTPDVCKIGRFLAPEILRHGRYL